MAASRYRPIATCLDGAKILLSMPAFSLGQTQEMCVRSCHWADVHIQCLFTFNDNLSKQATNMQHDISGKCQQAREFSSLSHKVSVTLSEVMRAVNSDDF